MSSSSHQEQTTPKESISDRLIRGAGTVRNDDPDNKLLQYAPTRWIVQMVQYMIAIILVTIGKSLKAIFSGETPRRREDVKRR